MGILLWSTLAEIWLVSFLDLNRTPFLVGFEFVTKWVNFHRFQTIQIYHLSYYAKFFCKTLTASDTSTLGGFSAPLRAAEKLFPQLVGSALKKLFDDGVVKRADLWITSKLWCSDHAPEDVPVALDRTLQNLQLDYLDLYLIHMKKGSVGFAPENLYPPNSQYMEINGGSI